MAKMNWEGARKRDLVRDRGGIKISSPKPKKPHGKRPKGKQGGKPTTRAKWATPCATCRVRFAAGCPIVLAPHGWVHRNCPPKRAA